MAEKCIYCGRVMEFAEARIHVKDDLECQRSSLIQSSAVIENCAQSRTADL